MLRTLLAAAIVSPLAFAAAHAQYQPRPSLSDSYERAIQSIAPPQQPTTTIQPAPNGGYTVRQGSPGNERSLSCTPGPRGGYDCR